MNEIDELQGQELDAKVAEMMGIDINRDHDEIGETSGGDPYCIACDRTGKWGDDIFGEVKCVRRFSEDIAAAFQVESRIEELGLTTEYLRALKAIVSYKSYDQVTTVDTWRLVHATPEQRCRAALKASGKGKDD